MPYQPAILGNARLNNFRLNYQSAALQTVRDTRALITINGVNVRGRVRYNSVTIRDVVNDTPNTCTFAIEDPPPTAGDRIVVSVNSNAPQLLFAGAVQTLDLSYEAGNPALWIWRVSAVDDTERLNRVRPYGAWVNTSASIVAETIVNRFAPGFTVKGIQPNLPAVSVNLDTSEGFSGALKQLAKLIGGYFYVEAMDVHLFQTEATEAPDPVDLAHRPLNDPPIAQSVDYSQLRTRVYGKGGGSVALLESGPGDTSIPVEDVSWFETAGGQIVAPGTQRLTYTGVQKGGPGTLVGPGITPSAAPYATPTETGAIEAGVHDYAVTFVTPSGETYPSPRVSVTLGPLASPPVPTLAPLQGGAVDLGTHQYAVTNVLASGGETVPGPVAAITMTAFPAPGNAPLLQEYTAGGSGNLVVGATYRWLVTFFTADYRESLPGPASAAYVGTSKMVAFYAVTGTVPPWAASHAVYRTAANGSVFYLEQGMSPIGNLGNQLLGIVTDAELVTRAQPPTNSTMNTQSVNVSVVDAPAGTVERRIYRTAAGAAQLKYLTSFYHAFADTYWDQLADSALGANAPTSGTAITRGVTLSGIPVGATPTNARRIYRTAAGQAQLKVLATIANNTATGYTDTAADAVLGANAPTADTSGIAQPDGQVIAGSTAIPVAGPSAFDSNGGWVIIGNGQQVIRYTGISGVNLVGIPTTGRGAIVATIGYNSTITAAPAVVGIPATGPGAIVYTILSRDPVTLWVQRDDAIAQASYGIHEGPVLSDERRTTASLVALCNAELALYANPIQTVTYATRDLKTRSGKTVAINFASPPIAATLVIQDATITELDIVPGLAPRFTVTASSVRFSLEDVLRRAAGAESTR